MGYPDFAPLEEGDALTAASLNTPLAALEDAVNAIEIEAVQRRGLRREHVPSAVETSGFSVQTVQIDNGTTAIYDNLYPGFSTNTHGGDGPGVGGTGWVTISHGGETLEARWTTNATDPNQVGAANGQRIAGLLVLVNVELVMARDDAKVGPAFAEAFLAAFAVGVKFTGDAQVYVLPESERFLCGQFNHEQDAADRFAQEIWQDAALRVFITPDTILGATNGTNAGGTVGTKEILEVYAMVSFKSLATMVGDPEVSLRHGEFTVIPIFAEEV